MKILSEEMLFIDGYFNFFDNQVIEIHGSDSDDNIQETHKNFVSREKFINNIKVFHMGANFKDIDKDLMLCYNFLDHHLYHSECGTHIVCEL